MKDYNNFQAFRIAINLPSQLSIFNETRKTKTELINDVINSLQTNIKRSILHQDKKYLFYFRRRIIEQVFLLQMAREDRMIQPVEGDKMVEEQELIVTPNIYFLIDVSTQIVLIQEHKSVFEKTSTAANRISEYFEYELGRYEAVVKLEAISKAEDLWTEIESAKKIFSLELDINPPNFFGARFKTNIDIKEAHEETAFEKFIIKLKNKFGGLKIERKDFEDLFKTLASGAGSFSILLLNKANKRIIYNNTTQVQEVDVAINSNELDTNKLLNDIRQLDQLNDNKPLSQIGSAREEDKIKIELKEDIEKPVKRKRKPKSE